MKITHTVFCTILVGLISAGTVLATEYETTMSFPKKGDPGVLRIVSGEGNITVTGYNGDEVIILSDVELTTSDPNPSDERARGLRRISGNAFRILTDEDENTIIINRSMGEDTDLEIRVPRRTSVYIGGSRMFSRGSVKELEKAQKDLEKKQKELEKTNTGSSVVVRNGDQVVVPVPMPFDIDLDINLTGLMGGGILEGNIVVSDITGDIEVSAIDGNITITGVTGSIIASSVEGNIEAELVRLTGDNPLSFSSVDGDIEVTLPTNLKANVQLKSTDGTIYTNYDIEMSPIRPESNSDVIFWTGGIGNSIYGTINGGGRDLTLKTVDGDIFFRKAE